MELIPALDVHEEMRDQKPEKIFVFHGIKYLRKYIFFSKLQAIIGNYYVDGFKRIGVWEDWNDRMVEDWNGGMMYQ